MLQEPAIEDNTSLDPANRGDYAYRRLPSYRRATSEERSQLDERAESMAPVIRRIRREMTEAAAIVRALNAA
jgi:hypothetical protein